MQAERDVILSEQLPMVVSFFLLLQRGRLIESERGFQRGRLIESERRYGTSGKESINGMYLSQCDFGIYMAIGCFVVRNLIQSDTW